MSVEFNEVSLPSLAQMRSGIASAIPAARLSDHDLFPSWEFVLEQSEGEDRHLLYRCAEGGLMWVFVDQDDMAHKATLLTNAEARVIWIEQLLCFSAQELRNLNTALQPGAKFKDTLESALGSKRVMRSFELPGGSRPINEEIVELIFCVFDGGFINAQISNTDVIVSSRLIQGREAWDLIQPFVDPGEG